MKFNYKLDYFENRRARRDYFMSQFIERVGYEELSAKECNQLMALNERLRQLEVQYLPIMNAKGAELQARVLDPSDWMQDFNLELVITFYLREDDPEYDEDDDNILMQITESVFDYKHPERAKRNWGFGYVERNYCDSPDYFKGEHHCYLYHDLYDHCYLDWCDLLRIGGLTVEVKIDEQSGMDTTLP